jgi:hypothetical protein
MFAEAVRGRLDEVRKESAVAWRQHLVNRASRK